MPRPKLTGVSVLLVVALVLATAEPGIATTPEPRSSATRFPPLLDCGPAPPVAPAGESAFRANLLSLLRDIGAATAAPDGFVSAQSGTTGRDSAFVRGLCFGGANTSAAADGCSACLSAAARDATGGCGASRRAGVWRAGCFLSYADADDVLAREEAFRGWFYVDGPDTTTLKDGVCIGTEPDYCERCFEDAARAAAALRWLVRMRRDVIVVGYTCSLLVPTYVLPISILDPRRFFLFVSMVMTMLLVTMTVTMLLVTIIDILREDN